MKGILIGIAAGLLALTSPAPAQSSNCRGCCGVDRNQDGTCDVCGRSLGQVRGEGCQDCVVRGSPVVEIEGTIERLSLAPGAGMPFLELRTRSGVLRVVLGSMRYLMERNFNPKAGSVALVKGFRVNDLVFARVVEIPAENVKIELRDSDGVPLWHWGHHHGGVRHGWRH
jgi:hypothetical protein